MRPAIWTKRQAILYLCYAFVSVPNEKLAFVTAVQDELQDSREVLRKLVIERGIWQVRFQVVGEATMVRVPLTEEERGRFFIQSAAEEDPLQEELERDDFIMDHIESEVDEPGLGNAIAKK
jgi:hypothetical protein